MSFSRRRIGSFILLSVAVVCAGIAMRAWPPPGGDVVPKEPANAPPATDEPNVAQLPVTTEDMGYPLLMILNDARVQDELAVARSQREQFNRVAQAYLLKSGEIQAAALHASQSPTVPDPSRHEIEAKRAAALREFGRAAMDVLTPRQRRRLDQILFQLRSIDIFSEEPFLAALDLSEEQRDRWTAVRTATAAQMKGLRVDLVNHKIDRTTYEEKVHQGLVVADSAVETTLTSEQRAKIARWRGRPITFGRMHLRLVLRGEPQMARN